MDSKQVQFTSSDILEKDFKTAMRGYNQVEVDQFLDEIIKDYEAFQQKINDLQHENQQLKKKQNHSRPQNIQPNQQVNYDVLKRLSNLEKEVFGRKFAEADS